MPRNKDKGRLAPFVPLLKDTLDSQAWRFLSFGARSLYVALKRRVPPGRNVAYLSYRNAVKDLGRRSTSRIAEWYRELEHYGFIVLHRYGSLGVEGKGKAPQWRLTELGMTSKASPGGVFEPPTNDFLRWDGVLFEPKPRKRTPTAFPLAPVPVSGHPVVNLVMSTTGGTVKERSMSITGGTPKSGTVHNGGHTTVHNGGHRVYSTGGTGFCFSAEGNEHELANRFLAALSVRDASPKD